MISHWHISFIFILQKYISMRKIFSIATLWVVLSSFNKDHKKPAADKNNLPTSNPFAEVSKLPFRAPDFSRIKDADYEPALIAGIAQQEQEINKIISNSAAPTFENTLVALEKSGQLLNRVSGVFNMVTGANTNTFLQKLQEDIAPKLSDNQDAIFLNTKLFNRIKSVYDKRTKLILDKESQRLLESTYQNFVLAGANLSPQDKVAMKKLNAAEATLTAKFSNILINGTSTGALVVNNAADLAGISQTAIDGFAENAKAKGMAGKWLLPLQNTTQQPLLQSLSVRSTREQLYNASIHRAEKNDSNDTRKIIITLAAIRANKAKLMGFANYAVWKLKDQMAKSPEAVDDFFAQLVPAATAKVKEETAAIQALIDEQKGGFILQPYDWDFYAAQVRKTKFNLDEAETAPYFELSKVLEDGVFYAANQLYGLTFKERKDIPVYQQDVRVFDVFDRDGKPLALFYCDYFKRDNKNGGAWMNNVVGQSYLLHTKPAIYNVCNFTKPLPGMPALLSFDNVVTMFHEFGHALHGMFASQKYPSLSGTAVARDYVEFPSQFNEHWALDPLILKHYAVHYKTGIGIPQALVDKIKKAASFNSGYNLTEKISAALLDLQWHKLTPGEEVNDVTVFENNALHAAGLDLSQVPPRYRSTYFLHIWSNGYAAGYYAYQWTKMLETDAYSWFEENGGLTRANGQRFRNMILSKGNTEDYNKMFKDFRGRAPRIDAMKKSISF